MKSNLILEKSIRGKMQLDWISKEIRSLLDAETMA